MSHRSVVQLLEDSAKSLSDNIHFGFGLETDFNQAQKDRENTFIWLQPMTATPAFTANNNTENYQKTWNAFIFIFRMAKTPGEKPPEYKPTLDDLDELADKFIHRVNDWSMKSSDTVGALTLRNMNQSPIIGKLADYMNGWLLSVQITTSDDFEYCTPDNIAIYGNN
jgi:hypothetical protein